MIYLCLSRGQVEFYSVLSFTKTLRPSLSLSLSPGSYFRFYYTRRTACRAAFHSYFQNAILSYVIQAFPSACLGTVIWGCRDKIASRVANTVSWYTGLFIVGAHRKGSTSIIYNAFNARTRVYSREFSLKNTYEIRFEERALIARTSTLRE